MAATNGLLACALIFLMCIDVAAASRVRSSAPAAAVNKGLHVVENDPGRRKQKEQRVPEIEALGCSENPVPCCILMCTLIVAARPAPRAARCVTFDR